MHHPDQFFGRSHEHAIIDTGNPYIVSGHILCAAAELPLDEETDSAFFPEVFPVLLPELESHNLLRKTARGWVYAGRGRATEAVRLDGLPGETFRIMCHGRLLETMDRGQAYREAHPGAIMLHQGETYVVKEMDLELHVVRVTETEVDYYTQPLKEVNLTILSTLTEKTIHGVKCAFGDVEVSEHYTGYKIKRKDTIIGVEPLSLPDLRFRTRAFWFVPQPDTGLNILKAELDYTGGLHGAEHAIIAMMPLHVMCDRWDIGGLSCPAYGDTGEPVIFVYDACEGGVGLAEKAYELLPELIASARNLVRDCRCDDGCPSCIHSPKCGNDNQPLDKVATLMVLNAIIAKRESGDQIQTPHEQGSAAG
jgi:DEAD/DEAH box helicase domain-containing protein